MRREIGQVTVHRAIRIASFCLHAELGQLPEVDGLESERLSFIFDVRNRQVCNGLRHRIEGEEF